MEDLIHRILEATQADSYSFYLSAGRTDTFRAKIYPEYKAHRTQPKPNHYEFLKNYLIDVWKAEVAVNEEADDLLGKNQYKSDTVICSIDKDLLQISGSHYNFVKDVFTEISPEEGLLWFYKQLLIGDVADNIKGVKGIGERKASYIIDPLFGCDEEEMFLAVQSSYRDWLQAEWADQEWTDFLEKQMNNIILINGICLKIRTQENEIWEFPKGLNLNPETIPTLSYIS